MCVKPSTFAKYSILEFLINCDFMVPHKRAKPSYIARHIFCNHGWIKIMLNCFMPWGWVNSKNIISLCMLMGFTDQKTKRVKLQQKNLLPKMIFLSRAAALLYLVLWCFCSYLSDDVCTGRRSSMNVLSYYSVQRCSTRIYQMNIK